jgi:preprotein translocase subunit SecF
MVIVSIPLIILFRLPMGIDFTGGTLIEIKPKDQISVTDLRNRVGETTEKTVQVQQSGDNQFILRVNISDNDQSKAFENKIKEKLPDSEIVRRENIGTTVSASTTTRAIYGLVLASILIIMYLAYAFRQVPRSVSSWTFGTIAILTLIHDLSSTFAIYCILGRILGYELDINALVAALTILGFSVHDTIVVFDRIRENIIKNPQKSFFQNANSSVNQTFARSLNTSLTAILVLVSMLILGGSTIKPFILILALGIGIGTYSSIFIAAPSLAMWFEYRNKNNKRVKIQ